MRYILFVIFLVCFILSGCCVHREVIQQQKETTTLSSSIENKSINPYGKYSLETADVQVWFYDNHFIYLDRNKQVVKPYTTFDTEGK
ncbi:MAG: hypothetical protein N3D17_06395 [bacterium]|nr:hypothetical protein [bacterium]